MPCRTAKEFLSQKGVAFEDVNVLADADAREELVRRTGRMAVPVILVDDEVVVGFDRARLSALLLLPDRAPELAQVLAGHVDPVLLGRDL